MASLGNGTLAYKIADANQRQGNINHNQVVGDAGQVGG